VVSVGRASTQDSNLVASEADNFFGVIERSQVRLLAPNGRYSNVQEAFRRHGLTPIYLDSTATAARLKSEVAHWTAVAEKAGLRLQ
jgi:hypothetical protein